MNLVSVKNGKFEVWQDGMIVSNQFMSMFDVEWTDYPTLNESDRRIQLIFCELQHQIHIRPSKRSHVQKVFLVVNKKAILLGHVLDAESNTFVNMVAFKHWADTKNMTSDCYSQDELNTFRITNQLHKRVEDLKYYLM